MRFKRALILVAVMVVALTAVSVASAANNGLKVSFQHFVVLKPADTQVSLSVTITDPFPVDTCTVQVDGFGAPQPVFGTAQVGFGLPLPSERWSIMKVAVDCVYAGSFRGNVLVIRLGRL